MILKQINNVSDEEIELKIHMAFFNKKEYYYRIYLKDTDIVVGDCGIRLLKNPNNEYYGNIEYQIKSCYQGNNYAYKASLLLAKIASYLGESNLLITANPSNTASIRIIEKLGGTFIGIKEVPKKMKLYETSSQVARYNWNIKKEGKMI